MGIKKSEFHRYAKYTFQIRIDRLAPYDRHMGGIVWVSQCRQHKIYKEDSLGSGVCSFRERVGCEFRG